MSIHHLDVGQEIAADEAFVFASLGNWTCSVCAPLSWSAEDVEAVIRHDLRQDDWKAIDKSELGMGAPTPNPCRQDSRRQHWLMLRGL